MLMQSTSQWQTRGLSQVKT